MKPSRCFTGPPTVTLTMSLKTILSLVIVGFSISTALAQEGDLRLTCRFVRPEKPVQSEGYIWKKDVINVEYKITNVSGEHLLIPDPACYKPSITFTSSENDTVDFTKNTRFILYCMVIRFDYAFIELDKGTSIKFITNIVEDTKEVRNRANNTITVIEDIEYPFEKGEFYSVHSSFKSTMQGFMETSDVKYRIWNGELSCEDSLEFKYE